MSYVAVDTEYMAHALRLARRGLYSTDPNPRVGCVIVNEGAVVGEGWHEHAGEAHAEINALKQAGDRARGATVYVTLEPCCHTGRTPPCTDALIDAGVARVVVATVDPNPLVAGKGLQKLKDTGIVVESGVLEAEARELNAGFIKRMQQQRPFVRVKLAISIDGRTAMASGESKWISGEPARADVQRWRARSSAILTGVGTVLADDPSLNVRDLQIGRQPMRVVVDGNLSTPESAKLLHLEGSTLIATASDDADQAEVLVKAGAQVICLPSGGRDRVDLPALMQHLAAQEVNEVLVEAGAVLNGSLIAAGLVDELIIFLAPHVMGSRARGMFNIPGLEKMADRISMEIRDVRAIGEDWRITARPKYPDS